MGILFLKQPSYIEQCLCGQLKLTCLEEWSDFVHSDGDNLYNMIVRTQLSEKAKNNEKKLQV